MVADPEPVLARLPRHHTDDGGPAIDIGAVPFSLVGVVVVDLDDRDGACFFTLAF